MKDKKTNCPNCGAPIEHYYNYQCPYCKTFLHNTDEQIKKLNNVDIRIKDVEIERSPITDTIMITLRGFSVPKGQWYEEGLQEIIISGEDIGKPIGYRVQIPIRCFYESYYSGHFGKILEIVVDSLPPLFKENEHIIIEKLLEKLYPRDRRLKI